MRYLLLVAIFLLSACDQKKQPQPHGPDGQSQEQDKAQVFASSDDVQAMLRDRVRQKFQTGDDFQVVVTDIGYPIGTLMREGRTVAVTDVACTPGAPVHDYAMPNMFSIA